MSDDVLHTANVGLVVLYSLGSTLLDIHGPAVNHPGLAAIRRTISAVVDKLYTDFVSLGIVPLPEEARDSLRTTADSLALSVLSQVGAVGSVRNGPSFKDLETVVGGLCEQVRNLCHTSGSASLSVSSHSAQSPQDGPRSVDRHIGVKSQLTDTDMRDIVRDDALPLTDRCLRKHQPVESSAEPSKCHQPRIPNPFGPKNTALSDELLEQVPSAPVSEPLRSRNKSRLFSPTGSSSSNSFSSGAAAEAESKSSSDDDIPRQPSLRRTRTNKSRQTAPRRVSLHGLFDAASLSDEDVAMADFPVFDAASISEGDVPMANSPVYDQQVIPAPMTPTRRDTAIDYTPQGDVDAAAECSMHTPPHCAGLGAASEQVRSDSASEGRFAPDNMTQLPLVYIEKRSPEQRAKGRVERVWQGTRFCDVYGSDVNVGTLFDMGDPVHLSKTATERFQEKISRSRKVTYDGIPPGDSMELSPFYLEPALRALSMLTTGSLRHFSRLVAVANRAHGILKASPGRSLSVALDMIEAEDVATTPMLPSATSSGREERAARLAVQSRLVARFAFLHFHEKLNLVGLFAETAHDDYSEDEATPLKGAVRGTKSPSSRQDTRPGRLRQMVRPLRGAPSRCGLLAFIQPLPQGRDDDSGDYTSPISLIYTNDIPVGERDIFYHYLGHDVFQPLRAAGERLIDFLFGDHGGEALPALVVDPVGPVAQGAMHPLLTWLEATCTL